MVQGLVEHTAERQAAKTAWQARAVRFLAYQAQSVWVFKSLEAMGGSNIDMTSSSMDVSQTTSFALPGPECCWDTNPEQQCFTIHVQHLQIHQVMLTSNGTGSISRRGHGLPRKKLGEIKLSEHPAG